MTNDLLSRRTLVQDLALTLAIAAIMPRGARGADAAKLSVADPAALALGYVEDARGVDVKRYPSFVPGSSCENCLQLQGAAGSSYRPCSLFPGKLVAVSGWCASWTAEM
jgi:hypothetical protein